MLISGAAALLSIWNYNNLDNFLLTRLYRRKTDKDGNTEIDAKDMIL